MNLLKFTLTILLLSAITFAEGAVLNLTSEQLIDAQNNKTVVIDIRTPEEWSETGTIKDAKRIMFFDQQRKPVVAQFMAEFEKLVTSKDQPFILVCRSGSRTNAVTNFLDKKLGYSHGAHLAKGMKQWIVEKRGVEKR
jgi:rhodanese-related sulfurtransferase